MSSQKLAEDTCMTSSEISSSIVVIDQSPKDSDVSRICLVDDSVTLCT